jgi:hypothetical protein
MSARAVLEREDYGLTGPVRLIPYGKGERSSDADPSKS